MKRILLTITALIMTAIGVHAQARYDYQTLKTEALDRGVVALRQSDGRVFISWRLLRSDRKDEAFDVFRDGVKLNSQPLTAGGTWFIDNQPAAADAVYEVRGGSSSGRFTVHADVPVGYLPVKIQKPEGGKVPTMGNRQAPNTDNRQRPNMGNRQAPGQDGRRQGRQRWRDDGSYTYSANDASIGDVDGDGQMEIILKWDPSNAHDNAHDGYSGPTLLDCYRLDCTMLWRINLGRNIRSGAHYTPFIVYDLDGDGRCELMVKTADGTIDGVGQVIGDSTADWRNRAGRILSGPEYITVFDGLTGRALDTKPYTPPLGDVRAWGDSNANRSERYLAAVGYFGGPTASAVFCRGYYTRSVLAAWDWNGKELSQRWVFDTDDEPWRSYAGQGNHNLRVADVDGDGWDEITYGSMAVDHDGTGLYNTRMGHGDAIHLIAEPKTNRLFIWDCHENRRDGSDLRDARTGEVVFQIKSNADVGRCMAADIDPTNLGVEMWSTDSHGVRNMKGEVVCVATDADDPQHNNQLVMNGRWLSVNFGIWWDGDLLRELLDHETVTKYDWENHAVVDVQKFDGRFNNGTKSNPCLSADFLGDWREEVIIRNQESTELRIYSTTIPTDHRINCLLQDIPYRLSVATENVGYNQPPEAGYFIGAEYPPSVPPRGEVDWREENPLQSPEGGKLAGAKRHASGACDSE